MSFPIAPTDITAETTTSSPYVVCQLPVGGIYDLAAAKRAQTRLLRAEGIIGADVSTNLEHLILKLDPKRVTLSDVAAELEDLGYPLIDVMAALSIRGMTSSACVTRVRHALEEVPGVIEAHINPVLNRADVRLVAPNRAVDDLMLAVRSAGYGVTPLSEHGAVADVENERSYGAGAAANRGETMLLGIVWVLTIPLLLNLAFRVLWHDPIFSTFWSFALSSVVLGLGGARFAFGAWKAISDREATTDLLVILGTTSAYLYSLIAWMAVAPEGRYLYFETAAAIIAFIRLGRWLEAMVKHGTTRAIRSLMVLRAQSARVLRDGTLVSKGIDKVDIGDVVVVKPFERIPVDGVILRGESTVDESMITGAGLPEDKCQGDRVTGGTMNGSGTLHVEATRLAAESTLAHIIALVEEAQARKVPLQRFVDHVSTVFVPVVLGLAILTFFGWLFFGHSHSEAINAAVSVLIIACPCALGLAAPSALVAGTGAAAKAGILIRDIDSLQRAYNIDTILFDKTGTLSEGRPEVSSVEALDGDISRLLTIAASAQQGSEHPLGRAILAYAANYGIVPEALKSFHAMPGRGVQAVIEGDREVLIGNRQLMDSNQISMKQSFWIAPMLAMQGRTAIWVAVDGQLLGGLSVSDPLRADAKRAVSILKDRDLACAIVSGDDDNAVKTVASALSIKNTFSNALPKTKIRIVRRLQHKGKTVAMVGDGINDAPALAEANLGIAVGTAADAALQNADFTLLHQDVMCVVDALDVAHATWSKIQQNLALAFLYNVIALPVAAMGLLSPTIAGAAMALSSVSVVLNAFLLARWKPRPIQCAAEDQDNHMSRIRSTTKLFRRAK
jgi:Cu+-exporting ATPase